MQLWAGGPKFAKYNYDDDPTQMSETNHGVRKTFSETFTDWGDNWTIGTYDESGTGEHNMYNLWNGMNTYANPAVGTYVKCTYEQKEGVYGFTFTGVQDGYTDNSIFLPAEMADYDYADVYYWSGTFQSSDCGWYLRLNYWVDYLLEYSVWDSNDTGNDYLVRPVLKN